MLVICNSDKLIDPQMLSAGKLFTFGRSKALLDATFIIVVDETGFGVACHKSEIIWPEHVTGSTFTVRVTQFRALPLNLIEARCRKYNKARFGTVAMRDDDLEQYLKLFPVIPVTTDNHKEADNG